ncbi:MAG: PD40 domain-containing protein [Cyclobacteriaceae bacterium]|nr:PD40 domain-containing protein [Cyclobacteriaceae bacterium]
MRVIVALVLAGLIVFAGCSPEKKAMKSFRYGKYEKVIGYYRGVLKKEPNNGKANYFLAESYRLSNRIKESEPFYARAKGKGVNPDSVKLYYAKSLQANAKYAEARTVLDELESSTDNDKIKDRARREIDGLDYLDKLSQKKSYYKIKNLEAINTPFTEYAPVYSNNELYFTSSRSNSRIYEATGTPFTDIYKAETNGANVNASTIAPLPSFINESNINEGCITFTPDGKTMIFAKGNNGRRKGAIDVDLYLSRFRNGQWAEPTPININLPESWESTPALSPDGRTLYFSSNRKGGFGGLDIYSAQMDGRGRFGRVKNMGPEINTAGEELFPYVSESGKMFFSSDGHPGYGMLDIFEVKRANGKTVVQNLGQPVNSSADDFGIYLFKADRGFFTSNREGGMGDDDIYTFINEDPDLKVVNYYLQGITYMTRKDSTREILPNTKVALLDQDGEVMQDFVTGNDGKFLFRVYENEDYSLLGETDGFITKRQSYTTIGKSVPLESLKELVTNITLDTILVLDRKERNKIFRLENIYFGYDSAVIRKEAARELDKLVTLLNDNSDLKIEMGSHTDSIASDAYNIQLSQRRAEATVNYLIKKGIDPARLVAKGYGESKPIARNTNPDGSDNPVGRQRNRRTEFKILEIGALIQKGEDDDDKFFRNELKKNE